MSVARVGIFVSFCLKSRHVAKGGLDGSTLFKFVVTQSPSPYLNLKFNIILAFACLPMKKDLTPSPVLLHKLMSEEDDRSAELKSF